MHHVQQYNLVCLSWYRSSSIALGQTSDVNCPTRQTILQPLASQEFTLNGSPCSMETSFLWLHKKVHVGRDRAQKLCWRDLGVTYRVVTSCLPWTRKRPGGRERTRTECPNRYLATLFFKFSEKQICTLKIYSWSTIIGFLDIIKWPSLWSSIQNS